MIHLCNIFTFIHLMALELYNKPRVHMPYRYIRYMHTIVYRYRCLGLRKAEIFCKLLDKDCFGQTDRYWYLCQW